MKLKIENLSVGYFDKPVLKQVNLTAESGDLVVMLGKNGAGKSTLIKSIAGIIPVQQGKVYINDSCLEEISSKERARYTGVVLTDRIDVDMKVYEFISLGRQAFTGYFDHLSAKDKQVINDYIGRLNMGHYVDKNIHQLSDGELQKVLIARVLVQETPVVLLDEPTAHLDLENKAMIFKLLQELSKKQNKIVIVSTHDINLVLPLVYNIWLVDKQHVLEIQKNSHKIAHLFNSNLVSYDKNCQFFKIVF